MTNPDIAQDNESKALSRGRKFREAIHKVVVGEPSRSQREREDAEQERRSSEFRRQQKIALWQERVDNNDAVLVDASDAYYQSDAKLLWEADQRAKLGAEGQPAVQPGVPSEVQLPTQPEVPHPDQH